MSLKLKPITIGSKRKLATRQKKAAMRKAAEERLQNYTRNLAREILGVPRRVTVNKGDISEFSAHSLSQNYVGKLDMANSVWAPWSKSYRENI